MEVIEDSEQVLAGADAARLPGSHGLEYLREGGPAETRHAKDEQPTLLVLMGEEQRNNVSVLQPSQRKVLAP